MKEVELFKKKKKKEFSIAEAMWKDLVEERRVTVKIRTDGKED